MDKTLRNVIIAGTIVISLSIAYYFVVFLPKKEKGVSTQGITNTDVKPYSNEDSNSLNKRIYIQEPAPQVYEPTNTESAMDKLNRERDQKCQKDTNEYNTCMIEYNSAMTEYNACVSESSNPNSWRYNGYCFQPSNYCYKPICAY